MNFSGPFFEAPRPLFSNRFRIQMYSCPSQVPRVPQPTSEGQSIGYKKAFAQARSWGKGVGRLVLPDSAV